LGLLSFWFRVVTGIDFSFGFGRPVDGNWQLATGNWQQGNELKVIIRHVYFLFAYGL